MSPAEHQKKQICHKLTRALAANYQTRTTHPCMYAYPVLHASLSILTESAVTTNASPHARCPKCGLRPAQITYQCIEMEFKGLHPLFQPGYIELSTR